MAGVFFTELGLPRPDHALGIGGGGHASQAGRMLVALEPILEAEDPDVVVVFGDTNSTLAGALAAAKLTIPVAHVEAGLRSFDRRMPEEINRIVTDHLATWCFAPTPTAMLNLRREGIVKGAVETGDLMRDLASRIAPEVSGPDALIAAGNALALAGAPDLADALHPGGYIFATIHRAENREPAAAHGLAGDHRRCGSTESTGDPLPPSRDAGRAGSLRDHPSVPRPGRRTPRLSDLAGIAAPRRRDHDRLRWRPARGGVAGDAVPRAARNDRVGRGRRRLGRTDGRRRPGPGPGVSRARPTGAARAGGGAGTRASRESRPGARGRSSAYCGSARGGLTRADQASWSARRTCGRTDAGTLEGPVSSRGVDRMTPAGGAGPRRCGSPVRRPGITTSTTCQCRPAGRGGACEARGPSSRTGLAAHWMQGFSRRSAGPSRRAPAPARRRRRAGRSGRRRRRRCSSAAPRRS